LRRTAPGRSTDEGQGNIVYMPDQTKTEDEINKAEQHQALKQTFLRLLDDPQVQQKIVALLSRRFGQIRDK
jgi:hypothetical protein